jgi:hypothetical protein
MLKKLKAHVLNRLTMARKLFYCCFLKIFGIHKKLVLTAQLMSCGICA